MPDRDAQRAGRKTWRVLADHVAEWGELEVVHRRWECPPDVRDRLVENLEKVGVFGGAGVLVRRATRGGPDEYVTLLVRYGDGEGWSDAGANLHPGESFHDCAERAVEATTGLDVTVRSVLQAHVLYADDWTDRNPVPYPFLLFEALHGGGQPEARGEAVAVEWFGDPPEDVRYEELREAF
jgi:ADP-ribose pyrophosphatase YjhB (NUDIX family)